MELSLLGIRFLLAFVFITAGLPKLAAPDDFRRAVRNYQLLPFSLVRPVAVWLPRLELALAVVLLSGFATRVAASLAASALFAFGAAVSVNLRRGRTIECGCFGGSAPRRITWRLVATDVALGAGGVAMAIAPPPSWAGSDTIAVLLAAAVAVLMRQLLAEALRLRRALTVLQNTPAEAAHR